MNLCGYEQPLCLRPTPPDPMDLELLRRFVLGECDAAERAAVARWVAADPARARVIEAVRDLAGDPGAWTQRFDASAAGARLGRRLPLPFRRERVVRVRHGAARAPNVSLGARGGSGRRVVAWSLAAAVLVALGVDMAWRPLSRLRPPPPTEVAERQVQAPRGQRAELTLSDGSRVELAPGSRLSYPAPFTDSVRSVLLDGEAYFDVHHDAAHPFEVRTADGVVRDVGTAFLVRHYTGDSRLEVVVSQGIVAVRTPAHDAAAGREVDAGERFIMDSVGRTALSRVDPQRYLAWMHGSLVFDDTPFREVLEQLSRWYDADFQLADTALANRRFTGTFHDEPLDSVVRALALPMHVRFDRRGRTIIFSRLPHGR